MVVVVVEVVVVVVAVTVVGVAVLGWEREWHYLSNATCLMRPHAF